MSTCAGGGCWCFECLSYNTPWTHGGWVVTGSQFCSRYWPNTQGEGKRASGSQLEYGPRYEKLVYIITHKMYTLNPNPTRSHILLYYDSVSTGIRNPTDLQRSVYFRSRIYMLWYFSGFVGAICCLVAKYVCTMSIYIFAYTQYIRASNTPPGDSQGSPHYIHTIAGTSSLVQ